MNRNLITITDGIYTLEEIILNEKLLFYKNDNAIIDNNDYLNIFYYKYVIEKAKQNDKTSINDITFIYNKNSIEINLLSFKKTLVKKPNQ